MIEFGSHKSKNATLTVKRDGSDVVLTVDAPGTFRFNQAGRLIADPPAATESPKQSPAASTEPPPTPKK